VIGVITQRSAFRLNTNVPRFTGSSGSGKPGVGAFGSPKSGSLAAEPSARPRTAVAASSNTASNMRTSR